MTNAKQSPSADDVMQALAAHQDRQRAAFLRGFFKTGPGQYAEGDQFLGMTVPQVRTIARRYDDLPTSEALKLLRTGVFHEERLAALLILVAHFQDADAAERQRIFNGYLRNTKFINNWDLVDCSAPSIVGQSVAPGDIARLEALARSKWLWDRRIAIVATLTHIRAGAFASTLRIAEQFLADKHDLIHKATGWMLREVGKRDRGTLSAFLDAHAPRMPRTALRYAVEHYPLEERQRYLAIPRVGP